MSCDNSKIISLPFLGKHNLNMEDLENCIVDMPHSVTYLNEAPLFDWCVVRCASKNGHQKTRA